MRFTAACGRSFSLRHDLSREGGEKPRRALYRRDQADGAERADPARQGGTPAPKMPGGAVNHCRYVIAEQDR